MKDVSFEVKKGEVLGIIGKNGAGKSTLLKLLSQITSPTAGSVKARGRIASLLEVGTGFHPELTGRENIFLNGSIMGMSKQEIRSKLDEIIEFSGCAKYVDTPVKRYSSGMTVRLGFAVAAFLEPEILIVDEVLAVGDAEFRKKAVGKMQDVSSGEGRTVLFVSHNMNTIQNLCERTILMKDGQLHSEGKTDAIIEEYLSVSETQSIKLGDRKDRKGDGSVFFNDVGFLSNGLRVDSGISGKPLTVELEVISHLDTVLENTVVSCGIFNSKRGFLAACKSDAVGKGIAIKPGVNTLKLQLDKLPLNNGSYYLI